MGCYDRLQGYFNAVDKGKKAVIDYHKKHGRNGGKK